jgi:hypothetical protein
MGIAQLGDRERWREMEHKVEMVAVLRSGKVYHNTISVKCADRNKAIGKARRLVELWKGTDNIIATFGFFPDDKENLESNLMDARLMLRRYEGLILAS